MMKEDNGIINTIKKRRIELNVSQKEVAEMCGIPQSTIGRIESGSTNPTLSTLHKICNVLGLDITIQEDSSLLSNLFLIDPSKRAQVRECVKIATANSDILKIIVFGSAAQRKCTENSDLDLCFVMKDSYDKLKMHYSLVEFGKACNHNCDMLMWDHLKEWFQQEVMDKGVVVYDANIA